MKLLHPSYEASSCRIMLVALAILFTCCVGPVYSASEPGTVTIVLKDEPVTLDPYENTRTHEGQVLTRNVVETLTEMNPDDSSIMPRLATSWKQIDQNTWRFFLRKGVKFHDGADFNAEAVTFNIKRVYDQRLKISQTRTKFFSAFNTEVKALDSHTVDLKTDVPQPLLPTLMGTLTICSPHTSSDKLIRDPVGTGPYKFVKWDAGQQIILERFDGYWGKQPLVKKAVYIWRSEPSVRATMVLIGEADLAPSIAAQDAKRPDMDYSYLDSESLFLRIGEWRPPLDDRRVRLALNYAIDRNAIRGSILSKDVVPATQIVVPSTSGHNPDLKPWPYDPQKARQLLDEARKDGVPVDREILLVGKLGHFPGAEELPEALMAMFKAVGLNVKIKMLEAGNFRLWERKPSPGPGPYILQRLHDNSMGDAGFTVYFQYHCKGLTSFMCDKQVDELIEKAQVLTGEERKKLWQQTFKRIHEEMITDAVLFHMVSYARVGKRINYKPSMATRMEIQLEQITFK